MKKVIVLLLIISLTVSLCGCYHKIASVESEQVDAIIVDAYTSGRYNLYYYVEVCYEDACGYWENKYLYDYYNTRLGETIPCYMITTTYNSGKVKKELVYNEDISIPPTK